MDECYNIVLSGTKENILDLFKHFVNYICFLREVHEFHEFDIIEKYGFYLLESTAMGNKEAMDGWLESILYHLNTKQLVAILVGFFDEATGYPDDRWKFTIGDVYPDTAENSVQMVHLQFSKNLRFILDLVSTTKYLGTGGICDALLQLQVPSVTNGDDEKDVGQVDDLAEAINAIKLDEQLHKPTEWTE